MNTLRFSVLLIGCWFLTGCFQLEGVHVLHYVGESDTGSYRVTMTSEDYRVLTTSADADISRIMDGLRKWSRPTTRRDGNKVYLEDNTGKATMERFYDTSECKPATVPGLDDCHFAFKIPADLAQKTGWSIDWEVVLKPDMKVVSSNHQRVRRADGVDHLLWYFDGNRDNSASIDFVVRVPVAR